MRFDRQLLVTYECVNAIGTSLELVEMLEHFMRVFSRKSGAIVSGFWKKEEEEFSLVCAQGKRSLIAQIVPDSSSNSWDMQFTKKGEQVLYMHVGNGIMSFMFLLRQEELNAIESILKALHTKLDNAINACTNHETLLHVNARLEEMVRIEVEKNREKDKHIIQQSKLAQMGEMISMIAHQWRQPLGSIATVAASMKVKTMLKKFDLNTEEGQAAQKAYLLESLGKIENYIKFLTTTIDDFRNFFKPEKRKDKTSLGELVKQTLGVVGKALEVNGITIERDERSEAALYLYKNETMQVVLNLLKNAEDAIKEQEPSQKKIWIRTYDARNQAILEIEDSAGGIDEAIVDNIFDPYFSTKKERNGTGLGLYMSKTIIEEHAKGKISVHNTKNGACFTIALEIDEPKE